MAKQEDMSWEKFNIEDADIVILGTYPGKHSLDAHQFYANPTNQFWNLLDLEYKDIADKDTKYKIRLAKLKEMKIGLWDVLNNPCGRKDNSADRNITNVKKEDFNDLKCLKKNNPFIFFNGKRARKFYDKAIKEKWLEPLTKAQDGFLPSSSCANTKIPSEKRIKEWNEVIKLSKKLKTGTK